MMERSGIFSQTVVRTVLFNGGVPLIEAEEPRMS